MHGSAPTVRGQDLALQQAALKAAGCEKVYAEKISGARSDRPELARMLKALAPGDIIIVTRLDRLGSVHPRPASHRHQQGRSWLPLAGGCVG
jgi:DNA invertase Pin-like site-specific DNA recombinase